MRCLLLVAVLVAGAVFVAEGLMRAAGVADCFAGAAAGCCGSSRVSTAAICAFCRIIICFFGQLGVVT
jgi:hypothetical protein